jgi:hypothetical protein
MRGSIKLLHSATHTAKEKGEASLVDFSEYGGEGRASFCIFVPWLKPSRFGNSNPSKRTRDYLPT